jgi:hypothetical protein
MSDKEVARMGRKADEPSADVGMLFLQTMQYYTSALFRQLQKLELLPSE